MSRQIYALLVGIDDYPDPRHQLRGCVNDVTAMQEYLERRINLEKGAQLHVRHCHVFVQNRLSHCHE